MQKLELKQAMINILLKYKSLTVANLTMEIIETYPEILLEKQKRNDSNKERTIKQLKAEVASISAHTEFFKNKTFRPMQIELLQNDLLIKNKSENAVKPVDSVQSKNNAPIKRDLDFDKKSNMLPALGVENIAKTLSHIIIRKPDDKGMMIGIFGKWGRGKTYFSEKVWKYMKKEKPKYKRVDFSAWKYQDTKESWAYLYEVIMNQYLLDKSNKFSLMFLRNPFIQRITFDRVTLNKVDKWAEKLNDNKFAIGIINSKLYKLLLINIKKIGWTPIILFIMTFIWFISIEKIGLLFSLSSVLGVALLVKIIFFYFLHKTTAIELYKQYFSKNSFNSYLGVQAEVEKELSILLTTWIRNKDEKVVLFVDDIDRCNIEQVTDIVDGLRVILDNPEIYDRIIIVTLIDERILKEALTQKHSTLNDASYREYLEKIFIIGIKLNDLSENEIEEYLDKLLPKYEKTAEKILQQEGITQWKKGNEDDKNCNELSLHTTPAKYVKITRQIPIIKIDINQNNEIADFTRYKTISKKVDGKLVIEKILDGDINVEITEIGASYLKSVFKELSDITPRRMRIFYYKFSIMKRLLYMRMLDNGLLDKWNEEVDEKIIIDTLLFYSNDNDEEEFKSGKSEEINKELIYVAKMVSVF